MSNHIAVGIEHTNLRNRRVRQFALSSALAQEVPCLEQ